MAPKMKVVWVSLLLLAMLGCSNLARAQSDNGETNLSGVWKGTRTTTGNVGMQEFRVRSIQFSLTQTGESLSGSYKCFAGKKANADCANPVGSVTGGSVSNGKVEINVQAQPNSYNCTFNGSVAGNKMNGTFTCYAGGTLSSNGVWRAKR